MPSKEKCADMVVICRSQARQTSNPDTAEAFRKLADHYEAEAKRLSRS